MQLEAGKCYVDRKGREYGPLAEKGAFFGEGLVAMWHPDGRISSSTALEMDLVAEAFTENVPLHRMLQSGELIESGDEAYVADNTWIPVVMSIGCILERGDVGRIRRRIVPQASSDPHMLETECISHVLRPGVDSVWNGNAWIPYTGEKTCLGMTQYARARFAKSAAPVALPRDINYIPRYADGWKPEAASRGLAEHMILIMFHPDSTSEERERAASTLVEAVYPELLARKQ